MQFEYHFSELFLIKDRGVSAGSLEGKAEISVWRDGDWSVSAIYLTGFRDDGKTVPVEITRDEHPWLYMTIRAALEEGEYRDVIEERVAEEKEYA